MLVFMVIVLVVAAAVGGYWLHEGAPVPSLPPVLPKPFGLDAFEAHGLSKVSVDAVKVAFSVISFLEHPITVVQDAVEARAAALARSTRALADIEDNLEEIREIQADNVRLENRAKESDARASALDALLVQVSSVVGSK